MARKKASITSFLFGVLLGIILVISSVAYGGYWIYNNLSINEFERLTGQQVTFIEEESQLRSTVLKDIIGHVQGIPNMTFGQFKQDYGIQLPEGMAFIFDALDDVTIKDTGSYVNALLTRVAIGSILGAPYSDLDTYPEGSPAPEGAEALLWELRSYTISGEKGIQNITNNLTVGKLKSIFEITLPSFLPIADDTKISELGSAIDTISVTSVISAPEEDDNSMGAKLRRRILSMKKFAGTPEERDYYISEVSELLQNAPSAIYINDVVDMPDPEDQSPAAHILRALLKKKVDPDTGEETDYYKLSEIEEGMSRVIDSLELRDVLPHPSSTDTMPDKLLDFLITAQNPSNGNQPYKLTEIASALGEIKVSDIFDQPAEGEKGGIFDIIGWDTKLSELGGEGVTTRIKNATMEQWQKAGFISDEITLHDDVKNKTIQQVIESP